MNDRPGDGQNREVTEPQREVDSPKAKTEGACGTGGLCVANGCVRMREIRVLPPSLRDTPLPEGGKGG